MKTGGPDRVTLQALLLRRRLDAFTDGALPALVPSIAAPAVLLTLRAPHAPLRALVLAIAPAALATAWRIILAFGVRPEKPDKGKLERQWRGINAALMLESLGWAISLPAVAWVSVGPDIAVTVTGVFLIAQASLLHRPSPAAALVHVLAVGAGTILAARIDGGGFAGPATLVIAICVAAQGVAIRMLDARMQADTARLLQQREIEARVQTLLDERPSRPGNGPTAVDQTAAPGADEPADWVWLEGRVRTWLDTDPVTGLANRHALHRALQDALGPGPDGQVGGKPTLFALELDDFEAVGDQHGRGLSDALLVAVGARLRRTMDPSDLVARLGEDGFAVLLRAPAGDGVVIDRAHRLLAAVREPLVVDGQAFQLTAGIGIARASAACEAGELLRRAELALHAAKSQGRDRIALFDDALDRRAQERRRLETELREALGRDEMVLHYQPIVSLESGAVVGYEALLRWQHPSRGLLLPDSFLPVAETSGIIDALGDWVVRRALTETAGWRGHFRLAVNLSASQLRNPLLIPGIDAALSATGFRAKQLEFEITEHTLFNDGAMLERLRALGAQIALDDFGTGYSSLNYLRKYRFDRVKIDRSFVADMESRREAEAIVSAIIRLAQALGMRTTAEGVETPGQLDRLRKLGCDEAQGYLILEAMPAREIEARRALGAGGLFAA